MRITASAMRRPNRPGIIRTAVSIFLTLAVILFFTTFGIAKTTVVKTGPCKVTVTVKMELWGPNASQAVANRWKGTIESRWNGPTLEQVEAAKAERPTDDDRTKPGDRAKLERVVNKYKKNKSCSEVNCCEICFVMDIKVREGGADPTEGYHQIKVMPAFTTQTNAAGEEVQVRTRSSVRRVSNLIGGGLVHSTTATFADRMGMMAPEAHEVGHLMALEDQYAGSRLRDGVTVRAEDAPGHEHDIMNWNDGWPHEAGITEILQIAGVTCNCCRTADDLFVNYGRTAVPAGDAIAACNIEVMEQALTDLRHQKRNLALVPKVRLKERIELNNNLDHWIKQLEKALEDCRKRRPVTGSRLTDAILTGGRIAIDTSTFCNFWGYDFPLFPEVPDISTPPETPSEPPSTPGTTPPSEPVTPTTPEIPLTPSIRIVPEFPGISLIPRIPMTVLTPEIPTTSTPPPKEKKPPVKPPEKKPPTTYKVSRGVLDAGGKVVLSAMPGARLKVNLFDVPALPIAGNSKPVPKKDDPEAHGDPVTGHTDENGHAELNPDGNKKIGQNLGALPILASGAVASDTQRSAEAEAMLIAQAQKPREIVEIVIPQFKSYIVKLRLDKKKPNWNQPETYMTDQNLKPYVVRYWIVENSMYVVLNFPVVKGGNQ